MQVVLDKFNKSEVVDAHAISRHLGQFEQPQNGLPGFRPFEATRCTIGMPHLGHMGQSAERKKKAALVRGGFDCLWPAVY